MPSKIRKRGENTYELAVTDGYDYYNKQIVYRKTVKAANEREAKKMYYEFESKIRRGEIIQSVKIKLGDFALQWYKEYCEPRLAVSTLQNYKRCLQQNIIPAIGHIDIRELQPFHIVPFINNLFQYYSNPNEKRRCGNGQAALYCYRVLSSMLSVAVKWGVIPSNPCERVDPPKIKKHVVNSYNLQETQQMMNIINQQPIRERMLITLALATGMRKGEILALRWSDIDFSVGTLQVVRSCQVIPHQGMSTKEPKNESSIRCITLPTTVTNLLFSYKQWQNGEKLKWGDTWNSDAVQPPNFGALSQYLRRT
ncbi:MAG: tyrosine-type recombinase/integrase [Veillonellales bacterium]